MICTQFSHTKRILRTIVRGIRFNIQSRVDQRT